MAVKTIDSSKCQVCPMRQTTGCVVYDICPMDVYRLDEEGKPYIAYVRDCQSCFLCVRDCPQQAVYVTALVDFPILPY
jgi:NAD-dependent dihydropyrimidine dehydrogenase PreA subunit